jgi:hypothetical protein
MSRYFSLYTSIALSWVCFSSCASLPKGHFGDSIPGVPDYKDEKNWAALPVRHDSADVVPVSTWTDGQASAAVDVFFLHPTTYTGKHGQNKWNCSVDDKKVNLRTDQYPIKYQASIFNAAAKVYAPRYRQAHLHSFFTRKKKDAEEALKLAYSDIRSAFQYYLKYYNQGRPFILAGHSQGTVHAKHLLQEFVDGKSLQHQLVVAYLAGYTVTTTEFKNIKPCLSPEETGCFCSWRTFKYGYVPRKLHFPEAGVVVTNPVTWSVNAPECSQEMQLGGVLRDFNKVYPQLVNTCIHEDLLWVNKPKFPGSFFFTSRNYHIADYNFFYADVRKNAQDRVKAFLGKG